MKIDKNKPDSQLKHQKKIDRQNRKELSILNEFRPDVVALLEQPVSPAARLILKTICLVICLLFVFAYVGELAVVSTATGIAKPIGDVVHVQMPKTSTITAMKVTEGKQVKRGSVLFLFDDDQQIQVDNQSTEKILTQLKLEKQVLCAVSEGRALTDVLKPSEIDQYPEIKTYYTSLIATNQSTINLLENERSQQAHYVTMYEKQKIGISSEIKASRSKIAYLTQKKTQSVAKQELAKLEQQVADKKETEDKYYQEMQKNATYKSYWESAKKDRESDARQVAIKKAEMLDTLKEIDNQVETYEATVEQLMSNLASQEETIQIYQTKVSALTLQIDQARATEKAKLSTMVLDKTKEITQYQSAVDKGEKIAANQTVSAPISGTVGEIKTVELGKTLGQAQEVLTIVPKDASLYFDILIKNQDISYIHIGQDVSIKVAAFPFQKKGVLTGKVTYISPESERQKDGQMMYKAKVSLAKKQTKFKSDPKQVGVGMTVTADIEIGKRRIIDFFFEPVTKYLDETFKSR